MSGERWEAVRQQAIAVLKLNDGGDWTRASPSLYPHQWSWDSACIAVGWAHIDPLRALRELERLFDAQWSTGMVPHIVFDPEVGEDAYFPGPGQWESSLSPAAPHVATSGICQPPIHALALRRVWELTPDHQRSEVLAGIRRLYPRMLAWHRYLADQRDPERSGLVTVYHPWESTDNSPRWDSVLARIEVGDLAPFTRRDTLHVTDAAQRPTDLDYRRYLWLVELLKQRRYDDASVQREYPFLIKDVFFSAILVAASSVLLELADVVGAARTDREQLAEWIRRGRDGISQRFEPDRALCFDYDLRADTPIRVRTFACFAPLVAETPDTVQQAALLKRLNSTDYCGEPRLRWPLLPSTSPAESVFEPRNYWRGPTWPVVNWLLWRSLCRLGHVDRAEKLRQAALAQLASSGLGEYFEPFTGESLGSDSQSWTAALALDWIAAKRN